MTSKLLLKKSSITNKVPVVGDLEYGELAINYTDGKLYFKDASNTIQYFKSGAPGGFPVSDTAPAGPINGQPWWDSTLAKLFVYYNDGTSSQWVEASPSTSSSSGGTTVEIPTTYTTTTTSPEVISTINASSYRSGKYEIQLTSPIGFERAELVFIHNNTSVFITSNGISSTSQPLGVFTAQIISGNIQIQFTANNANTTLVFTKKLTAPLGTGPGQTTTTIPEDLSSGTGIIDLETGTGTIDLNGVD